MSKKKGSAEKRYVWRDPKTGRIVSVAIADPVVKPKGVSVERIREAVRAVRANRVDRSHSKRSA